MGAKNKFFKNRSMGFARFPIFFLSFALLLSFSPSFAEDDIVFTIEEAMLFEIDDSQAAVISIGDLEKEFERTRDNSADDGDLTFGVEEVESISASSSSKRIEGKNPEINADINVELKMDQIADAIETAKTTDKSSSSAKTARVNNTPVPNNAAEVNFGLDDLQLTAETLQTNKSDYSVTSKLDTLSGGERSESGAQLSAEAVTSFVNRHIGGVRACYSKSLKEDPNISGRVYVEFSIDQNGRITEVSKLTSTIQHNGLESCIMNYVRTWKYKGELAGKVTIRYPFIFERAL